jgi:hypothetical protein
MKHIIKNTAQKIAQSEQTLAAKEMLTNPKQILLITAINATLILLISGINIWLSNAFPKDEAALKSLMISWQPYILLVLLGIITYFFFMILIYSCAKLLILNIIKTCRTKGIRGTDAHETANEGILRQITKDITLKKTARFTLLNIMILTITFLIFAFFSFIFIMSVKIDYIVLVRNVLLTVTIIVAYIFLNMGQAHFIIERQDNLIRKSLGSAYRTAIEKMMTFAPQMLVTAALSLISWAIYLGIDWTLIRVLKEGSGTAASTLYTTVTILIAFIMITAILTYNQFVFSRKAARYGNGQDR